MMEPVTRAAAVPLLALLLAAGCGSSGDAAGSRDGAASDEAAQTAAAFVEAALRAEQRRDCVLVYSMLSHETKQALTELQRVEGRLDGAVACEVVSPHAAYEPASHWDITSTTVDAERGRVMAKVYGRECLEAGCDQSFPLTLEDGQWKFDLAAGLRAAATAPRPTTTLPR